MGTEHQLPGLLVTSMPPNSVMLPLVTQCAAEKLKHTHYGRTSLTMALLFLACHNVVFNEDQSMVKKMRSRKSTGAKSSFSSRQLNEI